MKQHTFTSHDISTICSICGRSFNHTVHCSAVYVSDSRYPNPTTSRHSMSGVNTGPLICACFNTTQRGGFGYRAGAELVAV